MIRTGLNRILLLGFNSVSGNQLLEIAHEHGWTCVQCIAISDFPAPEVAESMEPPAVAVVAAGPDGAAWIAALRALPGLWGGTPVLGVGDDRVELAVAGWLPLDGGKDATRAMIEEWSGPLDGRLLRDPDDACYRLLRLVGMTRATAMLARFAEQLEQALAVLAAPRDGAELRTLAHRVGGIAGLYGFDELGQAWLEVERGESTDPGGVASATRQVMARVRKWSRAEFETPG